MKHLKTIFILALISIFALSGFAWAGTPKRLKYGARFRDEGAAHSTPPSGFGDLYVNSDTLYFINDSGVSTSVILSGTAWDDLSVPDANEALDHTTYSTTWDFGGTVDMFTMEFTGDFGNVSGMVLEQKTGSPTDGTLLEVKLAAAETDPDFISFLAGTAEKFNVDAAGTITIAGVKGAGTTIDANSLDFVGAGAITSAASSALTLSADDGATAGEDLIVTANNITIAASGAVAIPADTTLAIAIDLTDTDITNAISVGTNVILLTTGSITGGAAAIDFTSFDVSSAGAIVGTSLDVGSGTIQTTGDLTVTGTANIGTLAQDALVPASAAPNDITIDGATSGAVVIAGTSTGTIWLGDNSGGATLVTVGDGTNLLLGEGSLTVDNDVNEDAFVITSDATSQEAINVTAGTTTGKTISVTADDLGSAGVMLYLDSDNMAADNYFIGAYDGSGSYNFSVGRYGAVVIEGNASTDVLTLTTGDVEITAGDIDLNNGNLAVDTIQDLGHNISRNYAGVGGTPVLTVAQSHASGTNSALTITSVGSAATALKIDQTGANNAIGIDLNVAGDYPAIDIDASAARTGDVIDILLTNQLAERALNITGAATSATGEGVIEVHTTGNMAGALLRLDIDTGTPAAIDGYVLEIDDDSAAQVGKYAVEINVETNEALYVSKGLSKFTEVATFTGGIDVDAGVDIDFATNLTVAIDAAAADYAAGSGIVTVYDDSTGQANISYLFRGAREASADAQNGFLLFQDASTGAAANGTDQFKVAYDGATTITGTASGTDALTLTAGDILVTSGHIDITTGNLTVATGNIGLTTGNLQTDAGHAAIGIGTADIETWETSTQLSALQIGGAGFHAAARVQAASDSSYLGHNAYFDDTDSRWEAISTVASDEAVMLEMVDGDWIFNVEDTALAGDAAITWIPSLIIASAAEGQVGIGPATAATVDANLHVESAVAQTGAAVETVKVENTNTDANGPILNLVKNGDDEADDDEVGEIRFSGDDSGNAETVFGYISTLSTDVTNGIEAGAIVMGAIDAGTAASEALRVSGHEVKTSIPFTQNLYYWVDEFDQGNAADAVDEIGPYEAFWTIGGTNENDMVNFANGVGGTATLITANSGDNDSTFLIGEPVLAEASNIIFEARLKVDDITTVHWAVGVVEGSYVSRDAYDDDVFLIGQDTDTGAANVYVISNNTGAGADLDDSGIDAVNNTYLIVKGDLTDPAQPRVWINGTEIAAGSIGNTIQAATTLMPYVMVQNVSGGAAQRTVTIDYFKIWQDRG